jgi:5-methylcytosine-specific restriction endonuclease McrA
MSKNIRGRRLRRSWLQRRLKNQMRRRRGDPLVRLRRSLCEYARQFAAGKLDPQGAALFLRQYDPCAYCAGPADTWDHIDARSRGGVNHPSNMTRACDPCNKKKYLTRLLPFLVKLRVA